MAQLKDLLVTGPARITGAVNFNQVPKCNTVNVALITDVTSAKEEAIEVANGAQQAAENAQTTADGAVTAAGNAHTRADEAYSLADSKTTMSEVEGKDYATKTEAQGYADEVLGTSSDGASSATVYGALAAADSANTNADGRLSKTGGTLTGNLVIDNGTNPYLALYETPTGKTKNIWYIQGNGEKLYLGGSISANQYPTSIDKTGLLTAKNISTTALSATSFSGEWKSGTTSIVHPGVSGTVALQGDLDIVTTVTNSAAAIVTDISSSGMGISVTKSTLENLGLNTVYKYKGTKTWAQLKAIASAAIGDVYSISDTDPEGNTNADWACYATVTAATGDNYATYWQSLGGKIDLSNYAQLNNSNAGKRQQFNGEQHMSHEEYCPTVYDIGSGIGCSLKNARSLNNQAIIGELLLPYTTKNMDKGEALTTEDTDGNTLQRDPNICQVTAGEMGVYVINNATSGKIISKTCIGTFTNKGWRGHAATLYDGTAGVLHWDGDYMLYPYDRSGTKLHFGTADLYKYNTTNGYIKLLDASNYTDYAPTKEGGGASGDWSINAASATLLKPTNSAATISYGIGTWGANVPATNAAIMWQQKFSNSAFNSDTGDIVLWLERQSESASVLNITLDGYFYQNLTKRVLDTDNISGEANWIPKFSNANSIVKGWQIKNMTGAGSSGWTNATTDGGLIPTMNTLAYWNGAYNSSGSSNLAYCNQGAFSTMATKDVSAIDCDILFSDSGTTFRQIRGVVGTNDYWRIGGGASSSNNGYMEIATADDGTEPIYVRQYTGAYTTIARTLTLLDASGNSSFPGNITVNGTINATSTITGSQFKSDNTAAAIRPSDSNEINFSSNATYIYFGYDNRTNSTGVIDTYKFGCHNGAINSCNGNIECGSVKLRSAATFTYNTADKCIDVLF